jgi:hypothetical protein
LNSSIKDGKLPKIFLTDQSGAHLSFARGMTCQKQALQSTLGNELSPDTAGETADDRY